MFLTGKVVRTIERGAFVEIKEGVEAYVQQLGQELENVMMMTGVSSLKEVSKKNIYK